MLADIRKTFILHPAEDWQFNETYVVFVLTGLVTVLHDIN